MSGVYSLYGATDKVRTPLSAGATTTALKRMAATPSLSATSSSMANALGAARTASMSRSSKSRREEMLVFARQPLSQRLGAETPLP